MINLATSIIIGTATKPINTIEASKNGYIVCEIPDSEFDPSMLGSKLEDFEQWDN